MLSFLNLQRPLCLNFKLKAFLAIKFRFFEKKLAALTWLQSLSYFVFLVVFSSFCDPFLQIVIGFCYFLRALYLFCGESVMTVYFLLGLWLKLNLQKPAQVFLAF